MGNDLSFNMRSDLKKAVAEFRVRTEAEMRAAASRAINRSLTTARAESVRALRKHYPGLKAKAVRSRILMRRARRNELTGVLTFSGKRFGYFGNFQVGLVQTPYGTGIKPAGRLPFGLQTALGDKLARGDLKSAFVQRSRRGRRAAVWLRVGKRSMPITPVVALGVSSALVQQRIDRLVVRVVRRRFETVLRQEMKFRKG